jgi:hypothetical protein
MASTLGKSNNPLNLYAPEVEAVLPRAYLGAKTEQKCSHCKEVKPIGDFWKDKSRGCGHQHKCKICCELTRKITYKPVNFRPNRAQVCLMKIAYWQKQLAKATGGIK